MKKINCEIVINAPRERVWNCLIDPALFSGWAKVFLEGTTFEGGWNKGDAIRFIALNKEGKKDGMISEIAESKFPEYISIRHIGQLINGVEDTTSEEVKQWAPSYENYTLESVGNTQTRFSVDMDIGEDFYYLMDVMWGKALSVLKTVAEGTPDKRVDITVRTTVKKPVDIVWNRWTTPEHIKQWNNASDDWCTPRAENDLRFGGKFNYRMEAKNGSMGFDFTGVYQDVREKERIIYWMDDGRKATILFNAKGDETEVIETFEAETTNSVELQQSGWQAILDNFKRHCES